MGTALLDDGYPGHPKIVALSDAAFRIHTTAICHVKRYRTGGFVATGAEVAMHPRCHGKRLAAAVAELESGKGSPTGSPLWEPVEGGWTIHDYESFGEGQEEAAESRDALDARRRELSRKRAEAGRRGGLRSAEQPRASGRFASEQKPRNATEQDRAKAEQDSTDQTDQTEQSPRAPARPCAIAPARTPVSPSDPPLVLISSSPDPDPTCQVSSAGARGGRTGRRWRRVPAEWQPNAGHTKIARDEGVDLARELAKFRDHEFSVPKSDADAAFRNWLRGGHGKGTGKAFNRAEDQLQAQLDRVRQLEAEEAQERAGT